LFTKKEGKTDLAEFLVNRTPHILADIFNSAWEIENAQKTGAIEAKPD